MSPAWDMSCTPASNAIQQNQQTQPDRSAARERSGSAGDDCARRGRTLSEPVPTGKP
jgi:hypothetical protein